MPDLCTDLGHRLMDSNLKQEAMLCFICARNLGTVTKNINCNCNIPFIQIFPLYFFTNSNTQKIMFFFLNSILDQVVKAWIETRGVDESPEALQDLVEVVMTLKSAAERMSGQALEINSGPLSSQLTKYASILAAQVCI